MNIHKHTKALSTAIAIASAAAMPALAQDAPPTQATMPPAMEQPMPTTATAPAPQAGFAQVDVDRNGAISKGEATGNVQLSGAFDSLDADGNGSLDSAEYAKYAAMPHKSMDNATMDDTTNDSSKPASGSH